MRLCQPPQNRQRQMHSLCMKLYRRIREAVQDAGDVPALTDFLNLPCQNKVLLLGQILFPQHNPGGGCTR